MRITSRLPATLVAAAVTTLALSLAAPARAGNDEISCPDHGAVSACQAPRHSPTSPGGGDLATQQLLGGGMVNPIPPMAGIS